MKHVVVAPVGENTDALFVGIREFPTEKVVLLATEKQQATAQKLQKELERFAIPSSIKKMHGENQWEALFRAVAEVKQIEGDGVLVNVAAGDRNQQCAATSAAYVNGIKAFTVDGKEAMMLPVMKFSYYSTLTDKKLDILRTINATKDCCSSLEDLGRKTHMSLPLVSYHVNGNLKSEGLRQLGLVETESERGRTKISLSLLGRLLLKGYVS